MKAVVTGGAGFIGSHLTELLLNNGHHVTVVDNFTTGGIRNISHLKKFQTLRVIRKDISRDVASLRPVIRRADWVFHLAALADIVPSINYPKDYHAANVDGTVNILELARNSAIKKFVYAASSSCYGIATEIPTTENAPIQPQYPYAMTKYIAESYVFHWGKVYNLPVISLRLFNVFGPRSRTSGTYGAVFGTFLAQKRAGKPLTIVGDGTQTRDFIYVSDVAQAFLKAAQSPVTHEIFNVGSDGTYSIRRLVELLEYDYVNIPKRPGEPDCTFADITKIKRELGWKPGISFEEGVRLVQEHIDYWKDAPVWTPKTIQKATKDWFRYLRNS